MSKRIILELVYPGGGSGQGNQQPGQGTQQPGQLPGVGKVSGIVKNQNIRNVVSKFGQSFRNVEQSYGDIITLSKFTDET